MIQTDNFEIKLINTVKKYKMLQHGDGVLVGLSGGKDSVALLYALKKLSGYFGVSVSAFHLNHGIRGEEAERDLIFSKELCERLSVPFYSNTVDIPSMTEVSTDGLEAVARCVRYNELQRVAKENGCNKIATAHTASDNTETVLITLIRNSHAKGIPPIRDNIVRPILHHTTEEILDYCKRNSLSFVTDSTNADTSYTRNFLRNKVLGELYSLSPSCDDSFMNFSAIQRANQELTEYAAEIYLKNNPQPLALTSITTLAENSAFYNVLYSVVCRCLDISMSYRQFDELVKILQSGTVGSRVDIGDGKYILRDYDAIALTEAQEQPKDYCIRLKHGENHIPDSDMSLWVESPEEYEARNKINNVNPLKVHKLSKNILIKYNIISNELVARSRQQGDKYLCRGITRSIKKYMIDEKIPASLRSRIPIVCDNEGILWVAGLGAADRLESADDGCGVISLSLEYKK